MEHSYTYSLRKLKIFGKYDHGVKLPSLKVGGWDLEVGDQDYFVKMSWVFNQFRKVGYSRGDTAFLYIMYFL